jgi:hypothetical protein
MKPLMIIFAMILFSSCKSLLSTYRNEVEIEKSQNSIVDIKVITESQIDYLPNSVKNYFRFAGFVGRPLPHNCSIEWEDVEFKMSPEKDWIPIKCFQFNSVKEPARFAYLSASKMGINMFVGRDKYQQGKGNMHIKLFGVFNLQNQWGRAMDESSLVTILSETLFVPGYALQPYITWEEIDPLTAKGTITYQGVSVSGYFHFLPSGEMTHFVSSDRNQIDAEGNETKVEWVAEVESYSNFDGLNIPGYVSATWKNPEGDYKYFKGKIKDLKFNQ